MKLLFLFSFLWFVYQGGFLCSRPAPKMVKKPVEKITEANLINPFIIFN